MNRRRFVASVTATAACAACGVTALRGQSLAARVNGLSVLLANADRIRDMGSGWTPIVATALAKMSAIDPDFEIRQIKQKFGGLRLYYRSDHWDDLQPAVIEAELLCAQTCEQCGRAASLFSQNGWIRTLCADHQICSAP
jgi:hypothetical protein